MNAMPSLFKFVTASCFFTIITGQFGLDRLVNITQLPLPEKIPELQDLPTPLNFLETLLNVTATELDKLVAEFDFDDVLSDHITFLLYQQNGSIVVLNLDSDGHYINISQPIKLIIHGWQSTGEHDFIKDFAKSYHRIGIHNVLGVDWSPHSKRNYLHSARGTKKVGEVVAQFIMKIIRNDTELLPNVHIIGHSLGAQSSGFAGKHIKKLTNGLRVGRITALDAAGPFFEFPIKLPKHLRINNDDAEYVDAMHTNVGFLGFLAPYADADYYIDFGGPIQTGCTNVNIFEAFGCSHAKSYQIFNKTIISRDYLATPCGSPLRAIANLCNENTRMIMGEHTSTHAQGDFFINIDNNSLPDKKGRRLRFNFGVGSI